jgi:hypothetical protein
MRLAEIFLINISEDPKSLLKEGYDAVCVSVGLWKPIDSASKMKIWESKWWNLVKVWLLLVRQYKAV